MLSTADGALRFDFYQEVAFELGNSCVHVPKNIVISRSQWTTRQVSQHGLRIKAPASLHLYENAFGAALQLLCTDEFVLSEDDSDDDEVSDDVKTWEGHLDVFRVANILEDDSTMNNIIDRTAVLLQQIPLTAEIVAKIYDYTFTYERDDPIYRMLMAYLATVCSAKDLIAFVDQLADCGRKWEDQAWQDIMCELVKLRDEGFMKAATWNAQGARYHVGPTTRHAQQKK